MFRLCVRKTLKKIVPETTWWVRSIWNLTWICIKSCAAQNEKNTFAKHSSRPPNFYFKHFSRFKLHIQVTKNQKHTQLLNIGTRSGSIVWCMMYQVRNMRVEKKSTDVRASVPRIRLLSSNQLIISCMFARTADISIRMLVNRIQTAALW